MTHRRRSNVMADTTLGRRQAQREPTRIAVRTGALANARENAWDRRAYAPGPRSGHPHGCTLRAQAARRAGLTKTDPGVVIHTWED